MNDIRQILELIYFASGPLLVLVGMFVLIQIRVAKKNIKITSQRDALRLAVEQSEFFAQEIIPLHSQLLKIAEDEGLAIFDSIEYERSHDSIKIHVNLPEEQRVNECERLAEHYDVLIPFINALEKYESVGYSGSGSAYCQCAELILPWHIEMQSSTTINHSNLLRLWKMWADRLEYESATLSIKEMKRRIAGINANYKLPIGVD